MRACISKDGNKLIYTLYEQAYGEGYLIDGYTYTLADGSYAAIENYKQDGSDSYPVQALSNSIYLFEATALNEQIWLYSFPQIYNAVTNQLLPIYPYSKENNNIKLAAVSQDERYAIFYSTLVNETEDTSVIDSAGIPLVMDTQTGEVRPALVAPRKALLFPYYGVFLYYCTYYIDDSSFYNTPVSQLPCNGFGDDPAATTHSEYISRSIKAFDLDPDNVRFHNQNRYLSFEANSWFLDNSIAYEDFDYVPNDPYTPRDPSTRRDTFVVANPFIEEPLVYGEPLIDRSIDNGWFIWREGSSWHSELVAGGTSTTYDGAIDPSAFSAITSKESIEEQYGDRFRYPSKRTEFTLKVNGPWHDGFGFISSSGNDTCVYLKRPNNAKIYLGRNRTQVTNGAVLETQMPCDIPSIKTTGRPNINRTTDNGVFVWQEQQNNWRVEVVSAAQPRLVSINVDSEKTIAAVQLINIEANDLFRVDPKELSMELNVSSPWMDGFKFNVQNGSNTCVRSWSSLMPVFVGPDRVNVGEQINLQTLSACN